MANQDLNIVEVHGSLSGDFVPQNNDKIEEQIGEMTHKDPYGEYRSPIQVVGTGIDNLPWGLQNKSPCTFRGRWHVSGTKDEIPVVEFRVISCTVLKELPKTSNQISLLGRLVDEFKESNGLSSRLCYNETDRDGNQSWGNFVQIEVPQENETNIPRGLKKGTLGLFWGFFNPEKCKFVCTSARVISQPKPVREEPDYLQEPINEDGVVENVF